MFTRYGTLLLITQLLTRLALPIAQCDTFDKVTAGDHPSSMTQTASAEDPAEQPRADLTLAIEQSAIPVQRLILGPCRESLDLVHAYLPRDEDVAALLPLSAGSVDKLTNSLIVLTERRLLFVAPAPQALSWPLHAVTKFQVADRLIVIHAAGDEYMMGPDWDAAEHGIAFQKLVKRSVTAAILRG